jgi:hypothetical protein
MAGALTISTLNDSSGVLATQNGMTGIAKAWANFDGTSGSVRSSFNCSSVTRDSAGNYTFNFTTALANANYAVSGTAMYPTSTNAHFVSYGDSNGAAGTLPTTTAFKFRTLYAVSPTNAQDCTYVCISVSGS